MRKSSSVFFIQFWQLCSLVPLFKQGNMGCPNSLIIGLLQGQKLHEKSDLSQLPPFTTQNSEIILTWPIDDAPFSLLCSASRQKRTLFRWVCESSLPFFAVFEWASTWLHLEQHNSHSLLLRLRAWQVAIRPDDAEVAVVLLFLGCPWAKIDFFLPYPAKQKSLSDTLLQLHSTTHSALLLDRPAGPFQFLILQFPSSKNKLYKSCSRGSSVYWVYRTLTFDTWRNKNKKMEIFSSRFGPVEVGWNKIATFWAWQKFQNFFFDFLFCQTCL